jgi:signal transduction histidine kinase
VTTNELAQPGVRGSWRWTTFSLAVPLGACAGVVAAVAAVLLSAPSTGNLAFPVLPVGVGALFGLGFCDLARGRDVPFARALILAGAVWSLSALSASSQPALYSLGRVSQWLAELMIVYLLLVYPSGKFPGTADRVMFAAGVLLVGLLYLPTVVLARQFPQPSVWSTCVSTCPSSPLAPANSTAAVVTDVMVPMREALTVALFAAVAVAVIRRWQRARPGLRRQYVPIAGIAVLQVVLFTLYFPIRRANPESWALAALSWYNALLLPAIALACAAGRLHQRVLTANALARVAHDVGSSATIAQVRRAVAISLEDPSLQVFHSLPADPPSWVDESGSPVELPSASSQQEITEVRTRSWRIAIVRRPALTEDGAVLETVGPYLLAALENDRLGAEFRSSLERLAEARTRGIVTEGREREKLERDLHDGAQQRLVAMRLKLALAAEELDPQDPERAGLIRTLGQDVDATIDEVRGFGRAIYPPLLARTGLREALRELGRLAALPTTVHAEGLDRHPSPIEMAVYFSCSEALQNAARHARGATSVSVTVWQDGELHFEVHDNGAGFDVPRTPYGAGLTSIRDRLAALSGTVEVRSEFGQGTTIAGTVPIT